MMKKSKKIDEKMALMRKHFSAAYHQRTTDPKPDDRLWQQNLMRAIRQAAPDREKAAGNGRTGQLAWRLAPAAIVMMIIMAIMTIRVGSTLEDSITGLVLSDPVQTYMPYQLF
jgi:hypothetical protein